MLFDESTLRKLEQLSLVAAQVRVGAMKGDRRSSKRGSSVEFADFRNYVRGDDLRRLDWNIYARLERPFIKLLQEEEDLAVHILVDSSASMAWPDEEAWSKFRYARLLAGALGHIALSSGDLLRLTLLRSQGNLAWGPFRGGQNTMRLLTFLEAAEAAGITDLDTSLRQYALRARRPGLLLLLSDFLSPAGYAAGLAALQARGYELVFLHLLSPDEVDPPVAGEVKLVDVETAEETEITLDAGTLALYRRRLEAWRAELAGHCARHGVHYVPLVTGIPWERVVLQTMRQRGLVK